MEVSNVHVAVGVAKGGVNANELRKNMSNLIPIMMRSKTHLPRMIHDHMGDTTCNLSKNVMSASLVALQ